MGVLGAEAGICMHMAISIMFFFFFLIDKLGIDKFCGSFNED